jgi:hypothetical protein
MSETKTTQAIHAVHVRQQVYDSILDFVHGMPQTIDRIVVDMLDTSGGLHMGPFLVIFFWEDKLGSFVVNTRQEYERMGCKLVRDVEIPDELFMAAIELNNLHLRVKDRGLDVAFKAVTAG